MAELPDLTRISQMAMELPRAIMSVEAEHLSEKMGVLNTEVQKLGTAMPMGLPPLPSGMEQLSLPALPGLPGAAGMPGAATPGMITAGMQNGNGNGNGSAMRTRVRKTYMEV